jgi:hypothetical protein
MRSIRTETMRALQWTGVGLAVLVLAYAGVSAYGAWRWREATRTLVAQLERSRQPVATTRYEASELDGLPAPVQRFFRVALREGQPVVAAVELAHEGTFNAGDEAERWTPFVSRQHVVTRRPGFVWDARIDMLPGLGVNVHDAYVAGEGLMDPSVLGLVPLGTQRGGGTLAQGELMRYLAETAWYPTALLPSQGVRWEAVDERSARATLADADTRVTLTMRFGDDGLIESVTAAERGRTVGDRTEMAPWQGRFWNYATRDGMRIPLEGEVAWLLPDGPKPYWRGTIRSVAYEFATR